MRRRPSKLCLAWLTLRAFVLCPLATGAAFATKPSPPEQPAHGPGGRDYRHAAARGSEHGSGAQRFWVFEPTFPAVEKAPLVLFLHGYSALSPEPYQGWIQHIVRRGNIVVYPQYQKDLITPPAEYHDNTAHALRASLVHLGQRADTSRFSIVGHSAGAVGAATYASRCFEEKLPIPASIMLLHAGQGPERGPQLIPLGDYSNIPANVSVAIIVGEGDRFVGTGTSRRIWHGCPQVNRRIFITLQDDRRGFPTLHTHHLAPLAESAARANALDWLGYWRLLDEQCAAAWNGTAFAPSPAMGKWSDGAAVEPLVLGIPGGK